MVRGFLFKMVISKLYRIYLSTNFKYLPLEFHVGERCLCLAPHSDDESIGMGGTLLKYGKHFDVICLTDGAKGGLDGDMTSEQLVGIRKKEFEAAMASAGVNSFYYNDKVPDKRLILGYAEFEKIDIAAYDMIFLPSMFDAHRDHRAASVLLRELLAKKKHKKELKIVFYEVWSAMNVPNHYVDISDMVEQKKELVNIYQSQLKHFDYTKKVLGLNCYRGLLPRMEYAEAFCMLSVDDLKRYCQLT